MLFSTFYPTILINISLISSKLSRNPAIDRRMKEPLKRGQKDKHDQYFGRVSMRDSIGEEVIVA